MAAPGRGLALAVPRREGRLLQRVEHEASAQEGAEQLAQRPVEVRLRRRLAAQGDALAPERRQVARQLQRVARRPLPAVVGALGHVRHVQAVEAGVHDREDEPPARPQQPPQPLGQRDDVGHVEQGHVAHRRVVALLAQRQQRRPVGGVGHVEGNAAVAIGGGPLAGAGDQAGREVEADHVRAGRGQPQGVQPIAAGRVEHPLPRPDAEQPLRARPDEQVDEVVARRAHVVVPMRRVGLPRPPRGLVFVDQLNLQGKEIRN